MTGPGGTPAAASGPDPAAARRVCRLLRWYPVSWRERYAEEFAELLLADLAEQPRAWRRAANVARCGVAARLASAGLAGHPADPAAGTRACLGTLTCSVAVFLTVGTAMWAQLAVAWQWAPPASRATTAAMLMMSGSLVLLAVLAHLGPAARAGFAREAACPPVASAATSTASPAASMPPAWNSACAGPPRLTQQSAPLRKTIMLATAARPSHVS